MRNAVVRNLFIPHCLLSLRILDFSFAIFPPILTPCFVGGRLIGFTLCGDCLRGSPTSERAFTDRRNVCEDGYGGKARSLSDLGQKQC